MYVLVPPCVMPLNVIQCPIFSGQCKPCLEYVAPAIAGSWFVHSSKLITLLTLLSTCTYLFLEIYKPVILTLEDHTNSAYYFIFLHCIPPFICPCVHVYKPHTTQVHLMLVIPKKGIQNCMSLYFLHCTNCVFKVPPPVHFTEAVLNYHSPPLQLPVWPPIYGRQLILIHTCTPNVRAMLSLYH